MVKRSRFSLCIVSKQLILNSAFLFECIHYMILRQIWWYSTAATDQAAYIIGGNNSPDPDYNNWQSTTIAEYKNDQWRILGDLIQGRNIHGSISIGQQTMILGGRAKNGCQDG